MKTENPNKNIDLIWHVTMREFRSVRRKKEYQDIFNFKVTHSESRLAKSISKIMYTLDKNDKLNTSQIKVNSTLSWDSVIKSLKILYKKKSVKIKTIKDRKNNEKIYSLNRNRAICYHEHLSGWKNKFDHVYLDKTIKNSIEKEDKIEKKLPEGWWKKKITLSKNDQKRFQINENEVILENLPVLPARRIRNEYQSRNLCFECFEKGIISKVIPSSEDSGTIMTCMNCGEEKQYDDEMFDNKVIRSQERRRRFETSKIEYRLQKLNNSDIHYDELD